MSFYNILITGTYYNFTKQHVIWMLFRGLLHETELIVLENYWMVFTPHKVHLHLQLRPSWLGSIRLKDSYHLSLPVTLEHRPKLGKAPHAHAKLLNCSACAMMSYPPSLA